MKWVGGHKNDGEAEYDGPVWVASRACAGRLAAVAGAADEQAKDGKQALKKNLKNHFI